MTSVTPERRPRMAMPFSNHVMVVTDPKVA